MPSTPGGLAGGVLPESLSCLGVSSGSGILSFHDARGSFVELQKLWFNNTLWSQSSNLVLCVIINGRDVFSLQF